MPLKKFGSKKGVLVKVTFYVVGPRLVIVKKSRGLSPGRQAIFSCGGDVGGHGRGEVGRNVQRMV